MKDNILYVRSPHAFKGGVWNYSNTFISLLQVSFSERYHITDFSDTLAGVGEDFSTPNKSTISKIVANLLAQGFFVNFSFVIADIGLLEAVEFFFIYEIFF